MTEATAPCLVGCSVQLGALVSLQLQAALRSSVLLSAAEPVLWLGQ
jgi:hypothetical protein